MVACFVHCALLCGLWSALYNGSGSGLPLSNLSGFLGFQNQKVYHGQLYLIECREVKRKKLKRAFVSYCVALPTYKIMLVRFAVRLALCILSATFSRGEMTPGETEAQSTEPIFLTIIALSKKVRFTRESHKRHHRLARKTPGKNDKRT